MSEKRFQTYQEFWPYYLWEHSSATNRAMHFAGTTLAMGTVAYALATQTWWALPLALLAGYGPAWIGHFGIEKNRPATFKYPLWSLVSDFRMWALMLTGRLGTHLAHAQALFGVKAR